MTPSLFAARRIRGFQLLPLALAAAASCATPVFAQSAAGTPAPVPPGAQLSTIEVTGQAEPGTYRADDAAGTKTALPLRELPQSVRIVTRQAIDDLGATRLDDVLDHVGGVSRQASFGGLWDNIAIRGLAGNENTGMATLLNGFASNRGFNAPRDLAGVERIEFLKGPAAALYGSSEPGGILNIVSKRPRWQPAHAVELRAGSHGLRRAAFDSTGPIGDSFAYRLNVAAEERGSLREHVDASRQVVAPAFAWKLGRDTLLEYTGELLRHKTPLDRGVVAIGNRLGAVPRSRFLGEPGDGAVTVENQTHQFILSHEWNERWRSRVGLSWRSTSIEGISTEASALRADGTLTRQRRLRDYDSRDLALQAELQGQFATGPVAHDLLVGIEGFRFEMDTVALRANPSTARPYAISVFHPFYGQPAPTPTANTDTLEHQRGSAVYLQDAITLAPQWRLVAGVRFDRDRQSLLNRRTGLETRQSPSSTSPRLGVSWLPDAQWTVFANAGRSFRANPGADVASNGFPPETGRAFEVGAKWESADGRLGASAAAFDIRKRNVLTADPANPGYSMAAGEVRSRGVEFDFGGQLSTRWRIQANVAFNDAKVARDNTLQVGARLLNVPRVSGSMLAFYEDALANGQRWGLGGGIAHVGRRLGQARTQAEAASGIEAFELPGYTTAKLVAYWRPSPSLRLTLDVDNLFDRTYYASAYSRLWVTPGSDRTITVGLQARF